MSSTLEQTQTRESAQNFATGHDGKRATNLVEAIAQSIDQARAVDEPFFHLEFERVFPREIYQAMLAAMPQSADYRPMSGRSKSQGAAPTRVKMDLFPEYVRHLPQEKRGIWNEVGRALCSEPVKEAFIRRLEPGLSRRFGANWSSAKFFPIPILTRDIPGYSIPPHTDTHWKGITVQLYLPADEAHPNIGTIFHSKPANGPLVKVTQMKFVPNSGYAFAVGDNTWHSADKVGSEVTTRDSILLTYFVDSGMLRFLRNRGKRVGNFFLNEFRRVKGS
jgi:hypothetical protein